MHDIVDFLVDPFPFFKDEASFFSGGRLMIDEFVHAVICGVKIGKSFNMRGLTAGFTGRSGFQELQDGFMRFQKVRPAIER